MPPFTLPQSGVPFAPRALRTGLITQLESDPASVDPGRIGNSCSPPCDQVVDMLLLFTGQSAALIHDIVPAGELVRRLVEETSAALRHATRYAPNARPGR